MRISDQWLVMVPSHQFLLPIALHIKSEDYGTSHLMHIFAKV